MNESNALGLRGKSAVVTGAGRGIGHATTYLFRRLGVNVVGVDRKFGVAEHPAGQCGKLLTFVGDVTNRTCADRAVKRCIDSFGRLDILVNDACINTGGSLLDVKDREWDRVLAVNLSGYRNFARAAASYMIKKKVQGKIVNIASVDGMMAEAGILPYSSSKGAIIIFTKCLAIELARFGIRVNSIAPGWCDTPGGTGMLDSRSRKLVVKRIPLGYIAPPDEIARAIAFLASDLAKYLTGSILVADGGLTSDISIPGLSY